MQVLACPFWQHAFWLCVPGVVGACWLFPIQLPRILNLKAFSLGLQVGM